MPDSPGLLGLPRDPIPVQPGTPRLPSTYLGPTFFFACVCVCAWVRVGVRVCVHLCTVHSCFAYVQKDVLCVHAMYTCYAMCTIMSPFLPQCAYTTTVHYCYCRVRHSGQRLQHNATTQWRDSKSRRRHGTAGPTHINSSSGGTRRQASNRSKRSGRRASQPAAASSHLL